MSSLFGKATKSPATTARLLALVVALVAALPASAQDQPTLFSAARPGNVLPGAWQVQAIPKVARQTRFDLVADGGGTVLRARADDAAASLRHRLQIAPAASGRLSWRWKTDRVLAGSDLGSKAGDDYAARLYVFFERPTAQMSLAERVAYRLGRARYGDRLPAAALCYVWDNRQPVETLRDNAYTGFVKMIVATSGKARQGQWVRLQRDVAGDYRRAFGSAAPRITGIALSVDTDNTGESTISYFGDIRFDPTGASL